MPSVRTLLVGLRSHLPSRRHYSMAGSPVDVEYAYSVWLRHVSALARHGLSGPYRTVAEMGPGNSAVLAGCAILCGSESYVALDVLPHLARSHVQASLRAVSELLRKETPIPVSGRFHALCPPVADSAFPAEALARFRGTGGSGELPAGYERDISDLVHETGVDDAALAPRFRNLPENERTARSAHLILRKRRHHDEKKRGR